MSTVDPPPPLRRPATVQYLLIAFAVAGAALALAIGSIGIALTALGWAVSAKADTRGGGGSAKHATVAPRKTPAPAPPDTGYRLHYASTPLQVRVVCGFPEGLDLDEPQVSPDTGSDLSISGCSKPSLKLDFENDVLASVVTSPKAGPGDCSDAIRLGAGPQELTPVAGQSLCVRTSRSAAASEGHKQLFVLLHVDAIAADATMNLTVTAWDIPG
ncbi:MAG: hypothetical protein QOI35_2795 [Cryptosporangiaceae bacterium]|jgi:hypothetical protein|nr:hypothetical protein [Cryptosporangiaceae bacterium]